MRTNAKCNNSHAKSAKYFLLRAFTENVKQLSSILTNIWMLEATYYAKRFVKRRQGVNVTLECWSLPYVVVCWLSSAQYKHIFTCIIYVIKKVHEIILFKSYYRQLKWPALHYAPLYVLWPIFAMATSLIQSLGLIRNVCFFGDIKL